MDGKKGLIIGVIIALILMVGSFAFTGNSEQTDNKEKDKQQQVTPGDNNTSEEDEQNPSEEEQEQEENNETTTGGNNNGSSNGSNNNGGTGNTEENEPEVDESYEAAKKAVEKARESLELNDYNTAVALVEKVKDTTKKAELEAELEDIKNSINAITIVNDLEKKLEDSKNKNDIAQTIEFRDEKVVNALSNLKDSSLKEELQNRVNKVSEVLDDTDAPKIEGISNNALTNQDVKLTISDENAITKNLTLNGKEVDFTTEIKAEGEYVLVVTDAAFNETSVTFTIDKTAPEVDTLRVKGLKDGQGTTNFKYIKLGDTFQVILTTVEELKTLPTLVIDGQEITEVSSKKFDNYYQYIVSYKIPEDTKLADGEAIQFILKGYTDAAGNPGKDLTNQDIKIDNGETEVFFDKTAPVFEGLTQSGHYEKSVTINVIDNLDDVKIVVKNYNNPNNPYEIQNGETLSEEATYYITATDEAGNTSSIWIAIDNTPPTIVGIEDNAYTNENVTLTIKDKFLMTVEIDGKTYTRNDFTSIGANEYFIFEKMIGEEGKHTVIAKDKFGHTTPRTFTIDTQPPKLTHLGITQNNNIPDKEVTNGDSIRIYAYFDEELAVLPKVKLGKKTFQMEKASGENQYILDIYLSEDMKLEQGEIKFVIDGYKDKAGNPNENPLTNANITSDKHNKLIYDTIAPEFNFKNGDIFAEKEIVVTDDNFDYMTIYNYATGETTRVDSPNWTMYGENIEHNMYKLTAYDKVGNKKEIWIYNDNVKPNITGAGIINGNKIVLENGKTYQSVSLNVSDKNLSKVLVNEEVKCSYKWNEVSDCKLDFPKTGTYTVKAIDRAGNENELTFTIDASAPEVRVLGIAQNRNNPNTNVTNGDSIRIWVYFKEELAVLPKVKLGKKEYTMYHATDSDPYAYILDVVLDDTMKLEQGEIKFEIFGYSDKAGNTEPLTNKNITYTGKNDKLIYDTIKPKPSLIGVLNLDNFSTGNVNYAKIGDTVRVRVYFNELLAVEPTITIGGQTYTATLRTGSYSQTYGNAYYADIKLTEDMNLSLGKLKFTISNYQDKAGNVGETENQDSTNEKAYMEVTVLSDNTTSIVNGVSYNNFLDALRAANEDNPVVLVSNIEYSTPIAISKNVKIDLNGYDLKLTNSFLRVNNGGKLSIIGKGTVYSDYKEYAPIDMIGSASPDYEDYATLYIGKDVTLKGNSGILVFQATDTSVGYGVNITVEGTIEAVDIDDSSASFGIYIQGMIKNYTNVPNITLTNTAKIVSDAVGIYAAGYAVWNVNGAYIEGNESGIAIKSGILNVNSGTIKSTGEDQTPTPGFGNGVYPSGTAIQIESNKGYAGNIEINITGGTIESANSAALYEYLDSKTENTTVKNIKISGGRFITNGIKPSIFVSPQFVSVFPRFITGGIFSTNVSNYVMEGYNVEKTSNDEFEVVANNN